jgi:hypothetical protein
MRGKIVRTAMNRDEYAIRAANSVFQPHQSGNYGYTILGAIVLLMAILYAWC